MAGKIAQGTEVGGITTLIVLWTSAIMDWLNDNHLAVISIVTIVTGIVTIISYRYRDSLRKREVDLYEQEVKNKIRRKGD